MEGLSIALASWILDIGSTSWYLSIDNQLVGMQHLRILLLCDYLVTLKIFVAGSVITIAHEHNLVRVRQAMID